MALVILDVVNLERFYPPISLFSKEPLTFGSELYSLVPIKKK